MNNRYASKCSKCRSHVAAGKGIAFRGVGDAWTVRCAPKCEVKEDEAISASDERRVRFTPFMGQLAVRAAPSVKPSLFASFKKACAKAGTKLDYEDGRPVELVTVTGASALVEDLRSCGFIVEITTEVETALKTLATEARSLASWLDIEAEKVSLASRNQKFWGLFQEEGVRFLAERKAALLADPPGVGKTFQAILAVPPNSGLVVICPASVVGNWVKCITVWRPNLSITKFGFSWPGPGHYSVVSYAAIPLLPPADIGAHSVIIADEGHRLKGKTSKRTKRFRAITTKILAAGGRGYVLTGTPLENREVELWEVLEAVGIASSVFGTRKQFLRLIEDDRDSFIRSLKSVMLRRKKEDILPDLPAKIRTNHHVTIGDKERKELDDILQQIREIAAKKKVELYEKECRAENVIPDVETAKRIHAKALADVDAAIEATFNGSLDIPFGVLARVKSILATAKSVKSLAIAADMEPEAGPDGRYVDPIIYFSAHLGPARAAAKRKGWAILEGSSTQEERTQLEVDFQAGMYCGMAITLAGGEGINLYAASTIVVNDCDWKPSSMNQVEARCHRLGQLSSVQVVRVVTDHPLDIRILQLLTEKQEIFDGTVTRAEGRTGDRSGLATLLEATVSGARVANASSLRVEGARGPKTEAESWASAIIENHKKELEAGDLTRATARTASWVRDLKQGLTDLNWTLALGWCRSTTRSGDPVCHDTVVNQEIAI